MNTIINMIIMEVSGKVVRAITGTVVAHRL